jgi:nicotinate-nucleotide adenylyltransferase
MRLGIFGGSFDPVHFGHLNLARACQQQAALDEVWFMPTSIQPLKQRGPQASDAQRIEMLKLATADDPTRRVCTLEIDRGGLSYTVDTLRQIHEELPEAELFFLMGADTVRDVPHWKQPAEIFRLSTPLVVCRAGEDLADLSYLEVIAASVSRPQLVEMPVLEISSSEIRRRISVGMPIDQFVPQQVVDFIIENQLYQPGR